ncbi:MAG: hypothetical protein ACH255_08980 [Candidatus Thiodiazotropha sp.]
MEVFEKQRRNLIVISLAIIIYIAAGGDIQQGSIFGGTFTIKHKEVILWFGFIAYLYSLWRYWVYVPNVRQDLLIDFRKAQRKSKFYRYIVESNRQDLEHRSRYPYFHKSDGHWKIDYCKSINEDGGFSRYDNLPNERHIVTLRNDEAIIVIVSVIYNQTFHEKHISEYIFPAFIAFIAFIMILYKYVFQCCFLDP